MKTTSFLIALLLFAGSSAFAQTTFVWKQYSISFTLAPDFKEVVNNAEEFSAEGDGMEISIFPFENADVDVSDIAEFTATVAESLELEEIDDADLLTIHGLKGAYVEGYKDGDRVVLLGFIDPTSATNFFALITFGDNDEEAEKEAVAIIRSFKKK